LRQVHAEIPLHIITRDDNLKATTYTINMASELQQASPFRH